MNFDLAKMQISIHAEWLRSRQYYGIDPLGGTEPWANTVYKASLLHDLRLAAGHHTAGTCTKGAFRLAGMPDPARGTELWSRVVYVCAPDLHEVEALRAVHEAGSAAQEAVVSAYLLGGIETAELLILEVMTTPGGFFS